MFKLKKVGNKYQLTITKDGTRYELTKLCKAFQIMDFYMKVKNVSLRDNLIHEYLIINRGE
jgi:hypothetical protein